MWYRRQTTFALVCAYSARQALAQISFQLTWGKVPETPGGWGFAWTGGVAPYAASVINWNDKSKSFVSVTNLADPSYSYSWAVDAGTQVGYRVVDSKGTVGLAGPFTAAASMHITDPAPLVMGQEAKIGFQHGVPPYTFSVLIDGVTNPVHQQKVNSNNAADVTTGTWTVGNDGTKVGDHITFSYCDSQVCAGRGGYVIQAASTSGGDGGGNNDQSRQSLSSVSVASTRSVASTMSVQSVRSSSSAALTASTTSQSQSQAQSQSQSSSSSSSGPSSTQSSTSASKSTAAAQSSSGGDDSGGGSSNTAAIAGGAVGGLVGLLIVAILAVWLLRRQKERQRERFFKMGAGSIGSGASGLGHSTPYADETGSDGIQMGETSFPSDEAHNGSQTPNIYTGLPEMH